MLTAALTFAKGLARAVPVRTWLMIAAAVAVLLLALWIFNAGGNAVREDQAAATAAAEARAAVGRETAATERAIDTAATADKLEQWNHDAEQTPDAAPDDRELRRRCRQLRDAGRDLPVCRRFAG